MEKKELYFLVGGLLAVFSLFGLISSTYAVDDIDTTTESREEITMSPTTQKHEIAAGESYTSSFKVVNNGNTDFTFTVYTRPFSVEGEEYSPDYSGTSARSDAYQWVQFHTTESFLKPGETEEVSYTVRVPEGASIGGHYAVLFAETQPDEDKTQGSQIVRKKRVGMVLRVNVSGDIQQSGAVLDSSLPFVQFRAPMTSSFRVRNSGNVDFDVQSSINVTDVFGNLKYSATKANTTVYPDTTRRIEQNWDGVSWLGLYRVDLSATYMDKSYNITRYVLVIPRWLIALIVIVLVGWAYAAYIKRH